MRYPYQFTQTLNVSGNVRISDGWNITLRQRLRFRQPRPLDDNGQSESRSPLFNMSCSVVLRPYTSYNFTLQVQRLNTDRCLEIRQAQRNKQRRAVVLIADGRAEKRHRNVRKRSNSLLKDCNFQRSSLESWTNLSKFVHDFFIFHNI